MKAEPIWHAAPSPRSGFIYAKCDLGIHGNIRRLRVRCACSGPYQVMVNGRKMIRGLGGTLTQMPVWQEFDIDFSVRSASDTLVVLAGGHPRHPHPWFAAEGEITCENGSKVKVRTGNSWKVIEARTWRINKENTIPHVYFAAEEPEGRMDEWASEQEWEDAAVVKGISIAAAWEPRQVDEVEVWGSEVAAFGEIDAEDPLRFFTKPGTMKTCKCVHREGLLQPGKSRTRIQTDNPNRAVYLLLDFGRVVHGFPRLRLHGIRNSRIDLGFSRTWGKIETGVSYICTERYQYWTGLFSHTCRYVVLRLSNCVKVVELDCVSMLERKVATRTRGTFAATQSQDEIWETGRRTLEVCRQEIYSFALDEGSYDWLKAYAFALNDHYLSGDCQTAAATLVAVRPPINDPVQALAYLLFLETHHRYAGDAELAAKLLPEVHQVLHSCDAGRNGEGLLQFEGKESVTALNALYAGALDAVSRLFYSLKQFERAASCRHEFNRVRKALQQFWSGDHGLFMDCPDDERISQWTNALMLYFGLAHSSQKQQILHRIRSPGVLRVKFLSEAFFVAAGLWQAGEAERAINYIEQQWGRKRSKETLHLEEQPRDGKGDLAPGPEYFLGSKILGILPGKPGYEVVEVRPHPAGLLSAAGTIPTRRGKVGVQWHRMAEPTRFALSVELSKDGATHICVPRLGLRFPTLSLNGETVWRNEKIYSNPFVQEISSEEDYITLKVHNAGHYEVAVE